MSVGSRNSSFKLGSLLLLLIAAATTVLAETKQFTVTDNIVYAYDYVPAEGSQPTVILIHGFPSGRQDWHHQIDNLTAAGFGVIAPDCLGYGDSSKPLDVEAYSFKTIAGHFNAIIEHEGLETVVGVGHDWGSALLSNLAVYHGEKFEKLAFLNVAYAPPGPIDVDAINAEAIRQTGYTRFGYWYFFNNYDAPEVMSEHLESAFSLIYPVEPGIWRDNLAQIGGTRAWLNANTTTSLPTYLNHDDKDEWLRRYASRDDIAAPLNYYRSFFAGVQDADLGELSPEDYTLTVPVMSIAGALEAISSPDEIEAQTAAFATQEYRAEVLQTGHWPMLEMPDEVNALLSEFAARD